MYKQIFLYILIFSHTLAFAQGINTYQYNNVVNTGSKTVYKDGVAKIYYLENGISVTSSVSIINQYGKYYQINLEIENLTGVDFVFNPEEIVALMTTFKKDKKTGVVSVDKQTNGTILSFSKYYEKVRKRQNFQSAMFSVGAYSEANSAGYSASRTITTVSGRSNSYGLINNYYVGKSTSYGSAAGATTTQSYSGLAAYVARKVADKEVEEFNQDQYQIRSEINQKYLKINTLEHRQRIKGSINLEFEDVDRFEILVPVNGKYYSFHYNTKTDNNANYSSVRNTGPVEISLNKSVNELYQQAISLFNNKQFEEAKKSVDAALSIEPDNISLYTYRAQLNFNFLSNYEGALSDINNAIVVDKENKFKYGNYIIKNRFQFKTRQYDSILSNSNKAIQINPDLAAGYFDRALAKSELGDFYGAIADYERVISISSKTFKASEFGNDLGVVYNNIGYTYIKLSQYDKAKLYIEKAVELLPNYSYIWGSRGELAFHLGDYKNCISFTTTAIELVEKGNDKGGVSTNPSVPYYYRALAQIKKGNLKDACLDLSKASELGNSDAKKIFMQNCK